MGFLLCAFGFLYKKNVWIFFHDHFSQGSLLAPTIYASYVPRMYLHWGNCLEDMGEKVLVNASIWPLLTIMCPNSSSNCLVGFPPFFLSFLLHLLVGLLEPSTIPKFNLALDASLACEVRKVVWTFNSCYRGIAEQSHFLQSSMIFPY